MPSTTSRRNYYKRKTKEYYEKLGYTTQLTEFLTTRFIGAGKVIYVKKDVFGSDGISMNGEEIIFWNSKHSTGTKKSRGEMISHGKQDFNKFPFPKSVKRQLVVWELRKKPEVVDLDF